MKTKLLPLFFIGLFIALLWLTPLEMHAQELPTLPQIEQDQASLFMQIDPDGNATVDLVVLAKVSSQELLREALARSLSFPLGFKETPAGPDDVEAAEELVNEGSDQFWTMISAVGPKAFSHSDVQSICRIQLRPLLSVLQAYNVKHLKIGVYIRDPTHEVTVEGATEFVSANGVTYFTTDVDVRAPTLDGITLSIGYSPADILKRTLPLVGFLLLPGIAALFMSWTARKFSDRPAELWGRHLRFLSRLLNAIWIVWLPLYSFSGVGNIVAVLLGPSYSGLAQFIDLVLYFAPPILAMFLCHLASGGVYRRVRGVEWSPRDVIRQSIVVTAFSLIPLFLMVLTVITFIRDARQAAIYAVVGYGCWLLLSQTACDLLRPGFKALTSGDLRNRIFELAQRAGVLVKQIYLLPEEQAQLSNAFARSDNSVLISSSLVKKLSRREVDAIMAHEIGHLKEKHPQMMGKVTILVMVIVNAVGAMATLYLNLNDQTPLLFSMSLVIASLTVFFISRRNERHADAIGISLTGDPEAFISGLAKLSRLNLMPLHSGGWGESFETHPRTLGRLSDIARMHGISDDRLHSLLNDETAPDNTYDKDAADGFESMNFSSDIKKKYRLRVTLTLLGSTLITPLVFASILASASGFRLLVIAVVGFVGTFTIYQLIRNRVLFWGQGSLARHLRANLEKRGLSEAAQYGMPVGLSPAAESQKYEDYPFWDIGVLWLTKDKLYYIGEQTEFSLARHQVSDVYIRNARPEWLSEKNLYLQWRNESAEKKTLHFVAFGERSILAARRAIVTLRNRLEAWLNQTESLPPESSNLSTIAEPNFPEITSAPAENVFRPDLTLLNAITLSGYGVVIAFALGLPFFSIFYVLMVVILVMLIDEIPKVLLRKQFISPEPTPEQSNAECQPGSWAESNPATTAQSVE